MNETKNKIPEGYKTTKLGVIPEEWEVLEFDEIACRSKLTYSNKKDEIEYRCIELEHINQDSGSINGWKSSILQKSTKSKFDKGQVLFGKLRPYLRKFWLAEFEGVCSTEIWVLEGIENKSYNSFLFYLVQSNKFIQVSNATSGSKMPRADWWYVSKYPFILPPLPEQQKIASVLSTWDKAIAKQESLIKQKEHLKKGLMQELLTGKKRFAGFKEEWKDVKLGEIAVFKNGKGHENDVNENGDFILVNSKFIASDGKKYKKVNKAQGILKKESIVMVMSDVPNGKALAKCFLIPEDNKYTLNQRICSIVTNKMNVDFLLFQLNRNPFYMKFDSGVGQTNLKKQEVLNCPIKLPKLEEQQKIADVLSNANNEIENLKTQLATMKLQKQGLMQQLLTGKVRVKMD